MFSNHERCILNNNQLAEVICQFRFPEILIIGTTPPAEFQELIRADFPQYHMRKESSPPKLAGTPGNMHLEESPVTINHQFSTPDNTWRVNLTTGFISLTCSRYTCWEDFAKMLDKPLAAFIRTYHPAYFTRVGLRYLNFISRKQLYLEDRPFSDLIAPQYLGVLCEDDVSESSVTSCNVDVQMQLSGGCKLKLHAGPGMVHQNGISDKELRFIFDQDLFMSGNIAVQSSTGALSTLHTQAYSVFRGAILDTLYNAMDPEPI